MIERIRGNSPVGRSQSTIYSDLIWSVANASDENLDMAGQTRQALRNLGQNLAEMGSDKDRIISAHVFVANMSEKSVMDEVWREWIGENPQDWPQRVCLGVDLGGNWLIEITVVAARGTSS